MSETPTEFGGWVGGFISWLASTAFQACVDCNKVKPAMCLVWIMSLSLHNFRTNRDFLLLKNPLLN